MTRVCVHEFLITESEDVDLWAADLIYKWQQTPQGSWVMSNASEKPEWTTNLKQDVYGWQCRIYAEFSGVKLTEYLLRWT